MIWAPCRVPCSPADRVGSSLNHSVLPLGPERGGSLAAQPGDRASSPCQNSGCSIGAEGKAGAEPLEQHTGLARRHCRAGNALARSHSPVRASLGPKVGTGQSWASVAVAMAVSLGSPVLQRLQRLQQAAALLPHTGLTVHVGSLTIAGLDRPPAHPFSSLKGPQSLL